MIEIGSHGIYTDATGEDHFALVTAVHSPTLVNVVYVSSDESERDNYGRQIKRDTSVYTKGSENDKFGRHFAPAE